MQDMPQEPEPGMVEEASDDLRAKTPELNFDELMAAPEPDEIDAALARDLAQAGDTATEAVAREDGEVPCEFVCGRAGSGKSFWCKTQIAADSSWGLLCATTGIAAVNLDATTINSQLAYFD